jgi:hypothetical protein
VGALLCCYTVAAALHPSATLVLSARPSLARLSQSRGGRELEDSCQRQGRGGSWRRGRSTDVIGLGGGRAPEVVDERREVEPGLSAAEAQRGWRRRPRGRPHLLAGARLSDAAGTERRSRRAPRGRRADGSGGLEGALTCSPARGSPTRRGRRGEAGDLLEDGGGFSRRRSRCASVGPELLSARAVVGELR